MRLLNPWPVLTAATFIVAACGDEPIGVSTASILSLASVEAGVNRTFVVTRTSDAGPGSLRKAITKANASPGKDRIVFRIRGRGPHTIRPASALPIITDPVVIDGYTQRGARPNTNPPELGSNAVLKIELDGTKAGASDGLSITAGRSTIRGLVINRFGQDGIVVGSWYNVIEGNFIGTDVAGGSAAANLGNGVRITAAYNLVGGSSLAARNLISGNLNDGVQILGPGATSNRVEGNYMGVDATGTAAIGNGLPEPDPTGSAAVQITEGASYNIIGSTGAMLGCDGPCNVISGNNRTGVWINRGGAHNTVQGNFIGNDVSGTMPLGNARWGVVIATEASRNTIAGNRVVWNGHDGVLITSRASQNILGGIGTTPGT